MTQRYPHTVHISRDGEVRDRNALGYRGDGPILGWVGKSGSRWIVRMPGGKLLPDTYRTRHDGVWALIMKLEDA